MSDFSRFIFLLVSVETYLAAGVLEVSTTLLRSESSEPIVRRHQDVAEEALVQQKTQRPAHVPFCDFESTTGSKTTLACEDGTECEIGATPADFNCCASVANGRSTAAKMSKCPLGYLPCNGDPANPAALGDEHFVCREGGCDNDGGEKQCKLDPAPCYAPYVFDYKDSTCRNNGDKSPQCLTIIGACKDEVSKFAHGEHCLVQCIAENKMGVDNQVHPIVELPTIGMLRCDNATWVNITRPHIPETNTLRGFGQGSRDTSSDSPFFQCRVARPCPTSVDKQCEEAAPGQNINHDGECTPICPAGKKIFYDYDHISNSGLPTTCHDGEFTPHSWSCDADVPVTAHNEIKNPVDAPSDGDLGGHGV